MNKIMYVCEPCEDGAPEQCGYFNRDKLRVVTLATGAVWLCNDCLDNTEAADYGDGVKPLWRDLLAPPEYGPLQDELRAFHNAWVESEVASATGNAGVARNKRAALVAIHQAIQRSDPPKVTVTHLDTKADQEAAAELMKSLVR